jgi:hypothetical protein
MDSIGAVGFLGDPMECILKPTRLYKKRSENQLGPFLILRDFVK